MDVNANTFRCIYMPTQCTGSPDLESCYFIILQPLAVNSSGEIARCMFFFFFVFFFITMEVNSVYIDCWLTDQKWRRKKQKEENKKQEDIWRESEDKEINLVSPSNWQSTELKLLPAVGIFRRKASIYLKSTQVTQSMKNEQVLFAWLTKNKNWKKENSFLDLCLLQ